MESLVIRKSTPEDVADIMRIYDSARRFMRSRGNPTQWSGGYPSEALVQQDIARGVSYVGQRAGQILFVFAFILGEDPTYRVIEGSWLNDAPYGTIHRLASAGIITGGFDSCVEFRLHKQIIFATIHTRIFCRCSAQILSRTRGLYYIQFFYD